MPENSSFGLSDFEGRLRDDMAQVEVKELDAWRTVVVVTKVGAATFLVITLSALARVLLMYP